MKNLVGPVLLSTLFPLASTAVTDIANVQVKLIHINRSNANDWVFIKLSDRGGDPHIVCHTNTSWDFVLPLAEEDDKAVYTLILAAQAQGTTVRVVGEDNCNLQGKVETLKWIITGY